jgi:hypothetical protein
MYRKAIFAIVFFGAVHAWSQVEPSATGGDVTPENDQMMMPPPVSGIAYPPAGKEETRSNYIRGGVGFTTAFDDNVLAGNFVHPVSDRIYSVLPTISLDQTTTRQHRTFSYTAGFTFYDPTNTLNEIDQIGDFQYDYRFNPRVALSIRDSFLQTSDVFSAPTELTGGQVSGTAGTPDVIAPFGARLTNAGSVGLTYQFGLNGMIGGGGTSALLDYLHTSQVPGLFNSLNDSGTVFYSRRVSTSQYVGALFLWTHISTTPVQSITDTFTSSIFYTLFLKRSISVSALAGGEYSNATESGVRAAHAWTPAITASVGWQGDHGSLAARYSRTVSAGGGLLGSYTSTTANATAGWQITKMWNFTASADYGLNKNETPIQFSSSAGGHSIAGTVSLGYSFMEHYSIDGGYDRLHESYSGIQAISNDPDSNREFISISYHFNKPLGR